jgi:hypothetical protein
LRNMVCGKFCRHVAGPGSFQLCSTLGRLFWDETQLSYFSSVSHMVWFLETIQSQPRTPEVFWAFFWGLPFVNIGRTWSIYEVCGVEKAPTIGWFHSCWTCNKSLPHGWWENLWNLRQQPKKWSLHALMNYKVSLTLTQKLWILMWVCLKAGYIHIYIYTYIHIYIYTYIHIYIYI